MVLFTLHIPELTLDLCGWHLLAPFNPRLRFCLFPWSRLRPSLAPPKATAPRPGLYVKLARLLCSLKSSLKSPVRSPTEVFPAIDFRGRETRPSKGNKPVSWLFEKTNNKAFSRMCWVLKLSLGSCTSYMSMDSVILPGV